MRVIETAGSAREIGLASGEELRDDIRHNVDIFGRWPSVEEWDRRLPVFLEALRRHIPHILEEMEAMAEGAGVPLDDVLRMNLPAYANELDVEECTNLVFAGGPDGPIWGKNNDGNHPERCNAVCARVVRPNDGIPNVIFTYAGMVAVTDGMNAEGVAVGHSSVGSIFQQSDHFVPIRLWAYECMLRSRNTADFVRRMTSIPTRGKGYSIVCVDREGVAVSIEAACPIAQVRRPGSERGHVNCVNYYQLPSLSEADRRKPPAKPNAIARGKFLDERFTADLDFSLDDMKALLRHHGDPSICRHGGADLSHTEYSMIGLPRSGRVLYYHGCPCEGEYAELRL